MSRTAGTGPISWVVFSASRPSAGAIGPGLTSPDQLDLSNLPPGVSVTASDGVAVFQTSAALAGTLVAGQPRIAGASGIVLEIGNIGAAPVDPGVTTWNVVLFKAGSF